MHKIQKQETSNKERLVDTTITYQRQLMKDYALCRCFLNAYSKDDSLKADISTSFYNELLLYGYSAQLQIDSMSKAFANSILPSKYPDYQNKRAVIYFCTEFYKSRQLDSIIKTMDAQIMK
jgi:hypothetical protein